MPCEPCGECNPVLGCLRSDFTECRHGTTTHGARLVLRRHRQSGRAQWLLKSGPATSRRELGDPTRTSTYALCGYDADGRVVLRGTAPAGSRCGSHACWRRTRHGFEYADDRGRDGLRRLSIDAGKAGEMHASVSGSGPRLSTPALPVSLDSLPLVVRLRRTDADICWQSDLDRVETNSTRISRLRGQ